MGAHGIQFVPYIVEVKTLHGTRDLEVSLAAIHFLLGQARITALYIFLSILDSYRRRD